MMRGAFLKSAAKVVVFSAKILHYKKENIKFPWGLRNKSHRWAVSF